MIYSPFIFVSFIFVSIKQWKWVFSGNGDHMIRIWMDDVRDALKITRRTASMANKTSEEKKRINVSEKRQITIPKRYYDKLGMEKEILCELKGDEIILRNIPNMEDNSEEILERLVNQGFEGNRLLQEFQKQKTKNLPEKQVRKPDISVKNHNGKVDEQIKVNFGNNG